METFSTRQAAVIASSLKTVSWLFRVQASSGNETVLSRWMPRRINEKRET